MKKWAIVLVLCGSFILFHGNAVNQKRSESLWGSYVTYDVAYHSSFSPNIIFSPYGVYLFHMAPNIIITGTYYHKDNKIILFNESDETNELKEIQFTILGQNMLRLETNVPNRDIQYKAIFRQYTTGI